jgi:hypothetical protein
MLILKIFNVLFLDGPVIGLIIPNSSLMCYFQSMNLCCT